MNFDDGISQKVYDTIKLGLDGYLIVFEEDQDIIKHPLDYDLLIPIDKASPSLYTEIRPSWSYSEEYPLDPEYNHLDIKFKITMYVVDTGDDTPKKPLTLVRTYPEWTETVPDNIAMAKDWLHPEISTADTGLKDWTSAKIKELVLGFHAERPVNP